MVRADDVRDRAARLERVLDEPEAERAALVVLCRGARVQRVEVPLLLAAVREEMSALSSASKSQILTYLFFGKKNNVNEGKEKNKAVVDTHQLQL